MAFGPDGSVDETCATQWILFRLILGDYLHFDKTSNEMEDGPLTLEEGVDEVAIEAPPPSSLLSRRRLNAGGYSSSSATASRPSWKRSTYLSTSADTVSLNATHALYK